MPDDDVVKQIDAMLNAGFTDAEPELEPKPEEETPEEEPEAETPEEPEEPETPEEEEEPEPEEPEEPEPEPAPAPEDDWKKKMEEENEKLRKQIEELHTKKEPKPEPEEPEPEKFEELSFIGDDDELDDLIRSPKKLNEVLNKVYKAGMDAMIKSQEDTVRRIPEVVKTSLSTQSTLKKLADDFWEDNKDLKPFRKVTAAVYEEIASEHPDWTVAKVFEETGVETRNRLELHKKAESESEPKPKNPRFPKTKSSRERTKPKTDGLLSEIDAMNKDL
jgi:hypothetical protein